MRRWEGVLGTIGAVLVLAGVYSAGHASMPKRVIVLDEGGCRLPTTILEPPPGVDAVGAAIFLHGLSANRRFMTYLCEDFAAHGFRSYLPDLPGHGDNTDRFTFARAEQCAEIAVESLGRRGETDPKTTILLGHSMGGAIAVRMADRNPMAATIAISPAPMITPRRMPTNLLVFSARYDLPTLKSQAESLQKAAGGNRTEPDDFAQRRAFEWQDTPLATHTSLLVDRGLAQQSEQWAFRALVANLAPDTLARNSGVAAYRSFNRRRFSGAIAGLLGILLLFPVCATAVAKLSRPARDDRPGTSPRRSLALAEGAVAALTAVLMLELFVPLKFLHLYAGDYLASILLVVGLLFLALNWEAAKARISPNPSGLIAAALLGLATILGVGGWLNWQVDDAWLNGPRWLRFAAVLPVASIFCFAEEVMLGPLQEGRQRAVRYAVFVMLRLELWLACVLAYYKLASGQMLIGILVVSFAGFSLLQRLATDMLLSRTGSATAAAVFGAILAAWFIAAVFPLT
jgi:pimeloyl-ACP methyl ester carboxylesterase